MRIRHSSKEHYDGKTTAERNTTATSVERLVYNSIPFNTLIPPCNPLEIAGGNTGIGFETAKELCNKGYAVTIAGRDSTKITNAMDKIRSAPFLQPCMCCVSYSCTPAFEKWRWVRQDTVTAVTWPHTRQLLASVCSCSPTWCEATSPQLYLLSGETRGPTQSQEPCTHLSLVEGRAFPYK